MLYEQSPKLSKKIRVALFADDVGRKAKGTAVVLEHLISEYISRYDDQLDLVLVCKSERSKYLQRFTACVIVAKNISMPKFSGFFSYLSFFIFTQEKFDITHFPRPTLHPFFWLLKVLGKTKKIVVTFHGAPESNNIPIYQTITSRYNRWFIMFFGKYFIDAVVVDSQSAIEQVVNYYAINKKRVSSIYLAADVIFTPLKKEENDKAVGTLKDNYNINYRYILSVSRLDPHKNIHRLIEAFIYLKKTIALPQHLVLMAGKHDPKYSELVSCLVKNSPYASHIHFLGFVEIEEMRFLYNKADVFVYVSLSEGFGLPLLEAMACGSPVVTSNISCMPEIAGEAAVMVDPRDSISIARGVEKILGNTALQDSLKTEGFKRVAQFSWKSTAKGYFKLYENCLYH